MGINKQSPNRMSLGDFYLVAPDAILRYISNMKNQFTAVYKKRGRWYVGWVEEIPGVNTQGRTIKEVKDNLKEAVGLVLETNRLLAEKEFGKNISREPLVVSTP